MKILQNEGFGEKRVAFIGDKGLERLIFHRNLSLNVGDRVEAQITSFSPLLRGHFADTKCGQVFIPVSESMTEGQKIGIQIVKEARADKVATAHLLDSCESVSDYKGEDISDKEMDDLVAEALLTDIPLPGGGMLHIERTRVCWTLDVDSGKSTAVLENLNQKAVDEIVRQIGLKNMGGLILIDFAGSKQRVRKKLGNALKLALSQDGLCSKTSWTTAGLFEIERRRERSDLLNLCSKNNPVHIYYCVRRALANSRIGMPTIRVSPEVFKLLKQSDIHAKIEPIFDKPISYFEILEK